MNVRLSVIDDRHELERRRREWLELLSRCEAPSPTLTPDWMLTWWRVFGANNGRRLRVGLIYADDRLIGLAPFLVRWHWYRGCIPFRRLELIGSGENEADEICSDYVGVLVEKGLEDVVARTLSDALAQRGFGTWDELLMPAMNGEARFPELFARRLSQLGIPTTSNVVTHSPYISLPSSWDEYLGALTSSHRALVKKSLRAFEQWSQGRARIESVRTPDELERGFSILRELHAERWDSRRAGGLFASQRFSEFHRTIVPKLLAEGALDLFWLSIDERPIAVQYDVVYDNKVYFYQGGRTLDVPRGIRPGTVLHAYAIRRAIEQGRSEYDFLAGTQRYKLELSLASRPIVELRAVRPVVIEAARRAAERGAERVRALRSGWLRGWSPESS